MNERVQCLVPFCRCTTGKPFVEWICSKHWRLIDKTVKRRRSRIRRIYKRRGVWTMQMERLDNRLWEAAKRQASERSMGL